MKHIIPTLSLLTLAAASAVAQTAAVKGNSLSYDRFAIGYGQSETTKGLSGGFTALLGDTLLVGGGYGDIEGRKDFDGIEGNSNAFLVGAKFSVGPGDLVLSYTYTQIQLSGFDSDLGLAAGLTGDTDTFALNYRQALNSTIEFSLGVARVTGDAGYAVIDGNFGAEYGIGEIALADTVDYKDTTYSVALRFNVTKQFDITAGYTFADENGWTVSAGYNF